MAIKMLVFDFRESEEDFFRSHELENYDISFFKAALNEETVKNLSQDNLDNTMVISVFVTSEVSEKVINSFKNLRIISTRSTSADHIDKKAVQEKNIAVINVEAYGSRSVAQFTVSLILTLVRHIIPAVRYVQNREQNCTDFIGRDISAYTLGVVGTGNIGVAVCKVAKSLGMKILAYDIAQRKELAQKYDINYVDFNTLLIESDIVTLHIPYTGDNFHMFGEEQFSIMKNTSYLINTSREELVDTEELYNALSKGAIKGAALDVLTCADANYKCGRFEHKLGVEEDCSKKDELIKSLSALPDVILTPHIAYETQDAIDYVLEVTFIAISDILKGGNSYRIY